MISRPGDRAQNRWRGARAKHTVAQPLFHRHRGSGQDATADTTPKRPVSSRWSEVLVDFFLERGDGRGALVQDAVPGEPVAAMMVATPGTRRPGAEIEATGAAVLPRTCAGHLIRRAC